MTRTTLVRHDWHDIREKLMPALIHLKFQIPRLRELLLKTGDAELIEGNTWGDDFWGVFQGKGKNMLGCILMAERMQIRKALGL